jgi:hypothetical protein
MDRRGVVSRRGVLLGVGAGVLVIGVVIGVLVLPRASPAPTLALPLRQVAAVALPGQASRFDYADVDPAAHRLWIAHLGDSTVVEVDLASRQVVRTIPDMANVTGVIVVPALHRVFASTPGTGQVVTLDEDSGAGGRMGRAMPGGIAAPSPTRLSARCVPRALV